LHDAGLARALDDMDREFRRDPRSRLFGCFPRTPGEVTTPIADGPNGPLREPVEVTCRTTIDAATFTSIRLVSGALILAVILRAKGARPMAAGSWRAAFCLFAYAAAFSFAYRQLTAATGALSATSRPARTGRRSA
jgi:hypothetical protein